VSTALASPTAAVALPAANPDALHHHARRYFDYAEDCCNRGAPELAAPFYRQAYVLLAAAVQPQACVPERVDDSRPAPRPSLDDLRRRLNRDTAPAVRAELQRWRQEGCHGPESVTLEGVAALLLGEREAAEQQFRDALALDPRHYGALVNLAGLLLADGRADQAVPLLQQALDTVDPDSLDALPALTNLSLAHQQLGQAMDSALLVQRVHQLKPRHLRPERLLEAAQTLQSMGDDPLAIELLQWLAEHQPSAAALRLLAALLERRGDYRQAALTYRRLHGEPASEPGEPQPSSRRSG
jgi:tetratricopeptide (TPR) repeat protein